MYTPLAATPAFAIAGFAAVELNPFGPLQEIEMAPLLAEELKLIVLPWHFGLLVVNNGTGNAVTATFTVAIFVQPCTLLTFTVYTPDEDTGGETREGF